MMQNIVGIEFLLEMCPLLHQFMSEVQIGMHYEFSRDRRQKCCDDSLEY